MRLRASLDALRRGVSDTVVDPRPRSLQLRLLHTRMSRTLKQSQVLVYQDVLCPWSWLAELRLSQLQRELAEVMRFVPRPYPLRPMESLPSEDEIARAVKDLAAAARERESLPLRSDLWTSGDPPRSSMEPLAARAGLQMNRFTAAFGSSQTRRLIREEHRLARGRGVRRVPTLVIGNRWMISGLRETGEYRELLLACVGKLEQARTPVLERLVH